MTLKSRARSKRSGCAPRAQSAYFVRGSFNLEALAASQERGPPVRDAQSVFRPKLDAAVMSDKLNICSLRPNRGDR